jgi:hypothetical protein
MASRNKSIAEQAAYWYTEGEKMLLSEHLETTGANVEQGARGIAGLICLAYGEGMMDAEYGHPSKRPTNFDDYWGDFLFDSDIALVYAGAIEAGSRRKK